MSRDTTRIPAAELEAGRIPGNGGNQGSVFASNEEAA
jgi:hypothetical protein